VAKNNKKELYDMDERRVWEKVMHTDARVTAMEGQMHDMGNAVSRIETLLLNKQPQPTALIGILFTALTLLAAMLFGMAQYTSLALVPITNDVAEHRMSIDDMSEFKEEMQYKLGALEEWQNTCSERASSSSP
jgi:hypothetical protein